MRKRLLVLRLILSLGQKMVKLYVLLLMFKLVLDYLLIIKVEHILPGKMIEMVDLMLMFICSI